VDEAIDLRGDDRVVPAHRAADARSRFLVNTSQEIRNRVSEIVGQTAAILDTALTLEQREALVSVQQSADSLLTLVNDLYDVSRLEEGDFILEDTPFLLRRTVDHLMKLMAPAAAEKSLQLTHEFQAGLPDWLRGDPGRLRQMIANLVDNAIKFTTTGAVRVLISGEPNHADGLDLHIAVSDTGIGIPEEARQRIFEWFTQGNAATSRNFGGIGLGLPIATRLASKMGGRIWVESKTGVGSTFHCTVTIRLGEAPDETQKIMDAFRAASEELPVLVISDLEDERRRLVSALGDSRMSPIAVAHLEPAFSAIQRAAERGSPIKAVVLAVGDDPFHVYTRFRAAFVDRIPTVVTVASGRRGDANLCRDLGIAGYLAEPYEPADVADMIQAVVELAKRGDTTLVTTHWLREGRTCLRVLIADDSPTNLKLTTRMLENRDHTVTTVENGRLALEALRFQDFDVVLMDVQMPVMDGLQATAAIRAEEGIRGKRIPIIGLTAYDDRQVCLAAGMDGHLIKPYRPQDLFQIVEELAANRSDQAL
jgi:two-component system sensor histidine kinase/response regulator